MSPRRHACRACEIGLLQAVLCCSLVQSVFAPAGRAAQDGDQPQSPFFGPRYSNIRFSQDLNILTWTYALGYDRQLGDRLYFELRERHESTLQRITARDLWKDNQNFDMRFALKLNDHLTLGPSFSADVRSDPLAGFDNNASLFRGGATLAVRPNDHIYVAPRVVSKWQTQFGQSDHGFGFGGRAEIEDWELYGYESDFALTAERDFFPQRNNDDLTVRYQIHREFYENTADTLVVLLSRRRRDSFDADQEGVFVRNLVQSQRRLENRLSYRVATDVDFYLRTSFASDVFTVNNLRPEGHDVRKDDHGLEAATLVRLDVQKPTWFATAFWDYQSRSHDDRRPAEKIVDPFGSRHPSLGFDTDQIRVSLGLRGGWRFSSSDSVGAYAAVSKFRYDTSDSTNPNSHDQLRWHLTFSHEHTFSPALRLLWRGNVFLNHFVYIASAFSGGNNWERVFQLAPEIRYRPSAAVDIRQSFTARAKYQTYDFDDPETTNRNVVNRQFLLTNVTNLRLTQRTWLEMRVNLELAEQGKLFYHLWRQRLAFSWRNEEVRLLFRHRRGDKFVFAPGCSFFQQVRRSHQVTAEGELSSRVQGRHTNLGPMLQVTYRPSENLEITVMGRTQVAFSSQQPTDHFSHVDVKLNWVF